MSEIVDKFPPKQGRPTIYPWSEWMDLTQVDDEGNLCSKVIKLYRGEDFNGQVESFRVLCHRKAKNKGLKVSTVVDDGGDSLIVEFYKQT